MKTTCRYLVLLAALVGWLPSHGQKTKNAVQLGDQYFAAGEYYTAANLYGQFLNPPKSQRTVSNFPLNNLGRRSVTTVATDSRVNILYKQAESYRLANYWQEAAAAYKECIEQYPGQNKDAQYWYAVCERSLGHYTVAEENIRQYLGDAGNDNKSREAAEKELQVLLFIQQQLARPDSILFKTKRLDALNSSEKGVFAPVHMSGNQFLVSSTQRDSTQVDGVNPYHSRLFYVTLNNAGLEEMTALSIPGIDPLSNQGAATISPDGKQLYFSQWKKENGQTVSSIYYTVKQADGWSPAILVPSVNTNGANSKQPFLSADGKYLFFASDRPGGAGGFDIWYSPLKEDGTIGEPVNAGSAINTASDEQAPFYHTSSSTLVYSSNGKTGMGGYDLFAAKGNETVWTSVENMGNPINSQRDDIYFFASEKNSLLSNAMLSSDRGGGCCLETYKITKASKNKRLTGLLFDCGENVPVSGAEVVLKDGSGKIWKTTTDIEGRYVFEPGNGIYQDLSITINKEGYPETKFGFKAGQIDESDLLTDKLISDALCVEKKPEPKPVEPEPLVIKVEDVVTVFFDFDKSLLKNEAVSKLDSIFTILKENTAATIQISGYTDGLGTTEYNAKLSDRRARSCADYLIKKGIEKERVTFVSFGACCPIEMELINGRDNPDGRSKNRRALINVKKE